MNTSPSPAQEKISPLFTDLYELNMAAAYFSEGMDDEVTFELSIRGLPKDRGFLVVAGLEQTVAFLRQMRFPAEDLDYLRRTRKYDGRFLEYLGRLRFTGDLWAMPEGELAFANEPLIQITAPRIQAQIIETMLLNNTTLQTMLATKATRVVLAAQGRQVIDFSARRDHGIDAAMKAARASFIGGCKGTSNVLAAKRFGIPAYGTMAHSFILSFPDELQAFRSYASSYPDGSVLLIDTYDISRGTAHAIIVGKELGEKGHQLRGVRIDSGDFVEESQKVRRRLDEAGLTGVKILCSGNLDEYAIAKIEEAKAPVDIYGVGTAMGTSNDAPSLNSIYKLVEQRQDGKSQGVWKQSENKGSLPLRKQVFRSYEKGMMKEDTLGLHSEKPDNRAEPLLRQYLKRGQLTAELPSLGQIQAFAAQRIKRLPKGYLGLTAPLTYPVKMSQGLQEQAALLRTDKNLTRDRR
ncbi:MAG: nicotinate phosphoribosyltransferase [DPANN group archaeon]|nr:nicotinate phosphoribosyltransferase [DPANN group archaeon]